MCVLALALRSFYSRGNQTFENSQGGSRVNRLGVHPRRITFLKPSYKSETLLPATQLAGLSLPGIQLPLLLADTLNSSGPIA
jgi:hypothetical protein